LPVLHQLCSPELLVGLDIDAITLRAAARHTAGLEPTVELIQADVRSIPVAAESFDAVVDFGTSYHIARGEEATWEIARVLKLGGVFAAGTKLSQFLSHPIRSYGRTLRLTACTTLRPQKHRGLWMSFEKCGVV
jgi:ubiquinone/menaquinone biosynthesis C-methylase UbiE